MSATWDPQGRGVMVLPSGRIVRGRALRRPLPEGPLPEFGLYLGAQPPASAAWPSRWVRWRDFRTPVDPRDAHAAVVEAWQRSETERVEIACGGGKGRTGTALACLAILDGAPPSEAVSYVREHYDQRAVETIWQRRYVAAFRAAPDTTPE